MVQGMPQPVRSRPPPAWVVYRVANPLMRRLLPSRLGRWLPGMALLRFRGRRTGTAYEVPVGIYDHEGSPVVFTDAAWSANFRGGRPVDVVRHGTTMPAYGELVTDPAVIGPAIRATLAGGVSRRMVGVAIERGHHPSDEELAAIRRAVVIRRTVAGPGWAPGRAVRRPFTPRRLRRRSH